MADDRYNVVFETTSATKGYEGIITWTSFDDKQSFERWHTEDMKNRYNVLAQGVSSTRAIEMSRGTPLESYLSAARQKATNPETGEVNPNLFIMGLMNVALAKTLRD